MSLQSEAPFPPCPTGRTSHISVAVEHHDCALAVVGNVDLIVVRIGGHVLQPGTHRTAGRDGLFVVGFPRESVPRRRTSLPVSSIGGSVRAARRMPDRQGGRGRRDGVGDGTVRVAAHLRPVGLERGLDGLEVGAARGLAPLLLARLWTAKTTIPARMPRMTMTMSSSMRVKPLHRPPSVRRRRSCWRIRAHPVALSR